MYAFEPRLPINYVLTLVSNLRSGVFDRGDNLLLIGAITGEIGALLKSGPMPFMASDSDELPATLHGCCNMIDNILLAEDPNVTKTIDPSILIPVILKLIELWLARRGA